MKIRDAILKRKESERQERIERILKAGKKLFLKKGYLGTTMRDIALEAELSTGAIYVYFKGKDEIYGRVCEEAFHILNELLDKSQEINGGPLERLEAIARAYVRFYKDYADYFDIITFNDMGFKKVGLSEELLKSIEELSHRAISVINDIVVDGIKEDIIFDGIDSWKLSISLWARIEGLISIHKRGYLENYGLNLDELVNTELKLIMYGMTPR
jgi:TetR/AcrR family transcriptional regulator